MKQELVRINSIDGIEQVGILYAPNNITNKIVIHVHGLNGNFYENKFLDILAETYTNKNYAFLTFNNRGKDYISEFSKGDTSIIIGGSLERFKDCLLDIEGVIKWAKEKGYSEITLEGHSYGCNKVLYYYNKKKDDSINKIVLLAPCDIPSEGKKFLNKTEYEIAKEDATRLVNERKEQELIDFSVMANGKIAAGTYYYDFLPGSENNRIKDEDENDNKGPVWRDKEFDPTEKLIEKDESSGNKIINDKLKYDPRLSENQIDELKAEGLEPGDPEYDMYLRNTLGLKPQTEKKNNNNLKEDIKYNKISDWKSNDKNQALEVGKPKKKRSIRRAIGRATRNYGSGMKKKLQQRYKAKGGMGRRAIRTMAGIYGATALTAAGGLVGITSGDFTKSIQYMAAGTAGGYTLGKRISNNAINALKVDDTINELKKGYYADDYSKVEHKKNKEAFIKDENNIKRIEDKLKIERKEAKKIMEQHIKYYLDHDIYSIDDAIATYRLENEENMSRDKAIATAQYATQVMNGEDVNKMTAKRKKEYKDTFIPKFIEKGSKNPEEDVEKVFDNVSKFYLLKI